MSDEARRLGIRKGTEVVGSLLADSIRTRHADVEVKAQPRERPALRAAEQLLERHREQASGAAVAEEVGIPGGLFDGIEDRVEEKALLERALRSRSPVHILLVGDPGSGKSELLEPIGRLPRSRWAVGGATTSSGLIDYLLENPKTERLVIDELDKAETSELYALYSLMASGKVARLQHGATQEQKRTVWVFAAANSTEKLPPALVSRFVIRQVANYTPEQARQIMAAVLERREGLPRARAEEIAAAVASRSHDPRDAVQVGRLAGASGPIEPVIAEVMPA